MLIVMHHWATDKDVALVKKTITSMGLKPVAIPGAERTAIGIIGNQGRVNDAPLRDIKAILEIIHVTKPYKLVSRDFHPADTVVTLGGKVKVGGKSPFLVIAGPCAVESRDQLMKTAKLLKKTGVPVLRGGAYKPRTSPHSFQGLREGGLELLDEVRKETGLLVVTEVVSPEHVGLVAEHVDILQVGARNMQNFDLLTEVGKIRKPVILKRGLSGHARRMARFGGIHPARRQPERGPVRARHPHLRDRNAQYRGPGDHSARAGKDPSADHLRSEPCNGQEEPCRPHGAGIHHCRRAGSHDRGAS